MFALVAALLALVITVVLAMILLTRRGVERQRGPTQSGSNGQR